MDRIPILSRRMPLEPIFKTLCADKGVFVQVRSPLYGTVSVCRFLRGWVFWITELVWLGCGKHKRDQDKGSNGFRTCRFQFWFAVHKRTITTLRQCRTLMKTYKVQVLHCSWTKPTHSLLKTKTTTRWEECPRPIQANAANSIVVWLR